MPLRVANAGQPKLPFEMASLPEAERPQARAILDELGKAGPITPDALRDAFVKSNQDPARAAVLKRLIDLAAGNKVSPPGMSAVTLRASGALSTTEAQAAHAFVEKRIFGQPAAVDALVRIKGRVGDGLWVSGVQPFVFVGPTGVGKSLGVKVLAEMLHGDPKKVIHIDFATKRNSEMGASSIMGAGPGFVGFEKHNVTSALSKARVQEIFGDRDPIIVNLEDIDKAPPAVRDDLLRLFSEFIESGRFEMLNGERPFERADGTARQVVLTMTTNIGTETSKGLEGPALAKHFLQEFRKTMSSSNNDYLMGRITQGGVVPFGRLDADTMKKIAALELSNVGETLQMRLRKESDIDLALTAHPAVVEFLGEIGFQPEYGARPLKGIVTNLVEPTYAQLLRAGKDEEAWELRFTPETKPEDLRGVRGAFEKAEPGEIPAGVELPIELVRTSEKPTFHPYLGAKAFAGGTATVVHASGTVGGRAFAVVNAGDGKSKNELVFLQPGSTMASDKLSPVDLPKKLADATAMMPVQACAIDDKNLLFTAVSYPSGPDAVPEASAFLYDVEKRQFNEVQAPPVALQGGALAGVDGVAVLFGGVRTSSDEAGTWSIPADAGPVDLMGKDFEGAAYRFDLATRGWSEVRDWPSAGRMGAAAVAREGKLWFLGGLETFRTREGSHALALSRASTAVDVYDPKSNRATRGTDLSTPVVFASGFTDHADRINLLSGFHVVDGGRAWEAKTTIDRFNPELKDAHWKDIGETPAGAAGAQVAVVAHPDGLVVGPLATDAAFSILARN